ncbi:NAD-dependent epimerase/dehydratase family protein [Flagellimonas sp.]|uniref:NAD-dependent epimerase/dehydratase family protein n=1 Tax=Flagellimonas sp. TaxID=2058762 RepID=UPI003BA8C90F
MKKVIITGSTGMVGKGVLYECMEHPEIEKILLVNRSTLGVQHPKLEELLLKDFTQFSKVPEQLKGYDACFHCMGVSAVGMDEANYSKLTFDITKSLADTLFEINPNMTFNYVSGAGTDSSEKGRVMWARVKGKTENYLLNKGFKHAYMFRPGFIIPEKGIKSRTGWLNTLYTILKPFHSVIKKSKSVTSTTKIGLAMINILNGNDEGNYLSNVDINSLA